MGQFARVNEGGMASPNQPRLMPRPASSGATRGKPRERPNADGHNSPRRNAPSEWKYFVLALAALAGLGMGWLAGKAISGWLPETNPPAAVAAPAVSVMAEHPSASVPASQSPLSQESSTAQEAASDTAAPDVSTATVAQAAPDDAQIRHGRRAGRHVSARRYSRGNFFFRPFKAFRRLKVW
jgi:hypothetical protein